MAYSERFDQALAYASQLHRHQQRKGSGVPYISHLLAVASLVIESGGNEDEAIAALLHDAVEDQGGVPVLEDIARRFGPEVAEIVRGCTDSFVDQRAEPKAPWRDRKEQYLAHLAETNTSGRLVSCADKLHNARCLVADLRGEGATTWHRFTAGREGTLWYYRSVVDAFKAHGAPAQLLLELCELVDQMHHLAADSSEPDTGV